MRVVPSPVASSSKDRIRTAAAALFGERGYSGVSVREIAAAAQADPALVIRHFESKELLFLETMELTLDDEPLLQVPLERFGRDFVAFLLHADEGTRGVYLALVRGSGTPAIAQRLRSTHDRFFVDPLRARLEGPDAEVRARLAAALVGGLLYALWVVGDERLLTTDHEAIADRYGALLQALLTPPS
jgi:AcrR family transcriptional regulator